MTCYKMVRDGQKDVYVMVGNMPMLANRTELESTLEMECKSHIQMFHQYFFNLAPDDDYIKWTNEKAAYLADNSAIETTGGHARKWLLFTVDVGQRGLFHHV